MYATPWTTLCNRPGPYERCLRWKWRKATRIRKQQKTCRARRVLFCKVTRPGGQVLLRHARQGASSPQFQIGFRRFVVQGRSRLHELQRHAPMVLRSQRVTPTPAGGVALREEETSSGLARRISPRGRGVLLHREPWASTRSSVQYPSILLICIHIDSAHQDLRSNACVLGL